MYERGKGCGEGKFFLAVYFFWRGKGISPSVLFIDDIDNLKISKQLYVLLCVKLNKELN